MKGDKVKYKFLRLVKGEIVSENHLEGEPEFIWKIGKWYKEINLSICIRGFHCSKTILDAMSYVSGEVLAIVETKGKHISQSDKECWQSMRIVKAYKWTKKDSVALAIYSAELVLKNYEKVYPDDNRPRKAIEAAKKVLKKDTAKNRSAAWSARSAESAAESARSAAESARSAAWSARSAAWSEESAARSAALKKINKWLVEHIKDLEEIK
jgi:hypothetical protein